MRLSSTFEVMMEYSRPVALFICVFEDLLETVYSGTQQLSSCLETLSSHETVSLLSCQNCVDSRYDEAEGCNAASSDGAPETEGPVSVDSLVRGLTTYSMQAYGVT
jgi:hypothetical protein